MFMCIFEKQERVSLALILGCKSFNFSCISEQEQLKKKENAVREFFEGRQTKLWCV